MAATCTYTQPTGKGVHLHQWTWTSHTDGTVADVGVSSGPISGEIVQMSCIPLSGYVPSSGYDIELRDSDNMDWLFGKGANMVNSGGLSACVKTPLVENYQRPFVPGKTLTPYVTNAGDTKKAVLTIVTRDLPWRGAI